jgi:hypothetical protein
MSGNLRIGVQDRFVAPYAVAGDAGLLGIEGRTILSLCAGTQDHGSRGSAQQQ